MRFTLSKAGLLLILLGALHAVAPLRAQDMQSMKRPMTMETPKDAPVIPPVTGYSEGERILFLHTETSDPGIARVLTEMMGSPVLVVPALADTPEALLARVHVFENGLEPEGPRGPLGFQPDIFDHPPGSEGYRPLREIVLVRWVEPGKARLLRSMEELERAIEAGEITAKETGIVVNMPFLTWPGGRR